MATCNHAELGGERLYRSAIHSLISPRFLKSQSALGGNGTKEFDRCLIRSQPASNSGSTRLVYFNLHVCISTFLLKLAITVYMCGYSTEQYSLKVPSQIPMLLTDKILEDSCKYFDLEDLEGSLHISCHNLDKDPC